LEREREDTVTSKTRESWRSAYERLGAVDGRRFWVGKRRIGMYNGERSGARTLLTPPLMKKKAM
jgi:hypothetical protein